MANPAAGTQLTQLTQLAGRRTGTQLASGNTQLRSSAAIRRTPRMISAQLG
jgi:hypothetical protein